MTQGFSLPGPALQGSLYSSKMRWFCSLISSREEEKHFNAQSCLNSRWLINRTDWNAVIDGPGEQLSKLKSPQSTSKATSSSGSLLAAWKSPIHLITMSSCSQRTSPSPESTTTHTHTPTVTRSCASAVFFLGTMQTCPPVHEDACSWSTPPLSSCPDSLQSAPETFKHDLCALADANDTQTTTANLGNANLSCE